MIYFQVEDVNSKFAKLEDLEAKNWISEPKPQTKVNTVKKAVIVSKPFKPKAKASSNLKAMLAAKRKAAMKVRVNKVVEFHNHLCKTTGYLVQGFL